MAGGGPLPAAGFSFTFIFIGTIGMADYTDLIPANLRASVSDGTNLKPSITTTAYGGGTPSAANEVKRSIMYADGTLKESIADADGLKASWLLPGSDRPPEGSGAWLTEVGSAYASSTATGLSTGTLSLDADKTYLFAVGADVQSGTTNTSVFMSGDTTDANYAEGRVQTSAPTGGNYNLAPASGCANGGIVHMTGTIAVVDGQLMFLATSNGGALYADWKGFGGINASLTELNELEVDAPVDAGTWIKVWELEA